MEYICLLVSFPQNKLKGTLRLAENMGSKGEWIKTYKLPVIKIIMGVFKVEHREYSQ